MKQKMRVGIIFGGKSAEHEISLQSAKNIIEAMDTEAYEPLLIGVHQKGTWFLMERSVFLSPNGYSSDGSLNIDTGERIALIPEGGGRIFNLDTHTSDMSIDVAFPILHGPFGEDGTIQGLLKLAGIPFVGAGVLGSAVGMDKDVMKRLLRDAGVPIGKFLTITEGDVPTYEAVVSVLGARFFVKPANMGSSIGVSRVNEKSHFDRAIRDAFQYDRKILIEEAIVGREIECSVLGNEEPSASVLGEVASNHDFYSYEAKYRDGNDVVLEIPARISDEITKKVQDLAMRTFKVLACEGLGRVDFFLQDNGDVLVNEINTLPGFTSFSMYPKLWEASGISYGALIDRLIQLAVERFEKERMLKTFYEME